MSEEIKVGEYVRTKNGNIGKVLDITTCTGQKRKKYLIKWNMVKAYYITGTTIVKHSPNIIDLIEEGDYIQLENRGKRFYEATTDYQGKLAIIDIGWNEYEEIDETYNQDIKSIVTHEQFAEMEYKVNE